MSAQQGREQGRLETPSKVLPASRILSLEGSGRSLAASLQPAVLFFFPPLGSSELLRKEEPSGGQGCTVLSNFPQVRAAFGAGVRFPLDSEKTFSDRVLIRLSKNKVLRHSSVGTQDAGL